MIRHIVFFSARPGVSAEAVAEGLRNLARIPAAGRFEVALNSKVDAIGNDVDVVVYAEFADRAALDAFKRNAIYAETTALVRPLRELRLSADFEAQT